jgi:hypothetical protein
LREAEVPANMKVLFATGLRTPSLGTWNLFFREAVAAIKRPSVPFGEWERLTNLEKKHRIVAFRNGYAHGATPSDEECTKDIQRMYPVLLQLLGSELFLSIRLVASRTDGVYILRGPDKEKTALELDSEKPRPCCLKGRCWNSGPWASIRRGQKNRRDAGLLLFQCAQGQKDRAAQLRTGPSGAG